MRTRIPARIIAITLFCVAFTERAESQEARASNRSGISVWQEADFKGVSATFGGNVPDLTVYSFQRSVSSLRTAPGETWQVCDRPNYRGNCQVFTGSISDLDGSAWNDRIMSLRRVNVSGGDVTANDALLDRATRACSTELGRHGWSILNAGTPTRRGTTMTLEAQVRGALRSQQAVAQCSYNIRTGAVQIRF